MPSRASPRHAGRQQVNSVSSSFGHERHADVSERSVVSVRIGYVNGYFVIREHPRPRPTSASRRLASMQTARDRKRRRLRSSTVRSKRGLDSTVWRPCSSSMPRWCCPRRSAGDVAEPPLDATHDHDRGSSRSRYRRLSPPRRLPSRSRQSRAKATRTTRASRRNNRGAVTFS